MKTREKKGTRVKIGTQKGYKSGKGGKDANRGGKIWPKGSDWKGGQDKRKVARETAERVGLVATQEKGGNNNWYQWMTTGAKPLTKLDNDEELQAWCLLEENEHEQWQEVISRRDKQKVKRHY